MKPSFLLRPFRTRPSLLTLLALGELSLVGIAFVASAATGGCRHVRGRLVDGSRFIGGISAIAAGAHGYVTKEEGAEKAIEAIRRLLKGQPYVTGRLADRMLETMTGSAKSKIAGTVESLSDRELEILGFIGRGMGSAEIARRVNFSVKTIESHREHIQRQAGPPPRHRTRPVRLQLGPAPEPHLTGESQRYSDRTAGEPPR